MNTINFLVSCFQNVTHLLGDDKVVAVLSSLSALIAVLGFVVEYLFLNKSVDTRLSRESNLKSAQNEDDYPDWLLQDKRERNREAIIRRLVFSYFHWGFLPLRKGSLSRGAGQKSFEKGRTPSWRSTLLLCFLCTVAIRTTIYFASHNAPNRQQLVCHSLKLTLSAGLALFLIWLCIQWSINLMHIHFCIACIRKGNLRSKDDLESMIAAGCRNHTSYLYRFSSAFVAAGGIYGILGIIINGWLSKWQYKSLSNNPVTENFIALIVMLFMSAIVYWFIGVGRMLFGQWRQEHRFLEKMPAE